MGVGGEIFENKISPICSNTIAIKNFPVPTCRKDVQKFLGKINFYRKFIPNITVTLNPLYNLLKKDAKFEWSNKCQIAFDKMKEILTSKPVLLIFDPNKPCFLFTDASRLGIGAILKQEIDTKFLFPVGYFSKKLLHYQTNYSITELECLAIVESIEYFHHYLYNLKFTGLLSQTMLP